MIITWFTGSADTPDPYGFPAPEPTGTELQLGVIDPVTFKLVPGTLTTVLQDSTPTAYHYAEVHGLQPATTYSYIAISDGHRAQQSSMQFPAGHGGSLDYANFFTTLSTPPGRHLFTLALGNDLHIGEETSGAITNGWPPSFAQDSELPPYPEVMLEAMLGDLRAPDRSADRLLIAGDLTGNGLSAEAKRARQLLDGWGSLESDYFVTRGNHDRSRAGASWSGCTVVSDASPEHHDCWGDVFPYPLQTLQSYEAGGLRIIGLDTTTLDTPGGTMSTSQLGALEDELLLDPDRPTLVFGHHPVTYESAVTAGAGPAFNIDRPTAVALQRLYARAPGVFFHHSGHTHRNKRTFLVDDAQNPIESIEFLEVGAAKEYPGGYTLLRLHTGGYMVSYYKSRAPLALTWAQRTRRQYYSLYPHYMLGTIADRNHTVTRDLSGLLPHR